MLKWYSICMVKWYLMNLYLYDTPYFKLYQWCMCFKTLYHDIAHVWIALCQIQMHKCDGDGDVYELWAEPFFKQASSLLQKQTLYQCIPYVGHTLIQTHIHDTHTLLCDVGCLQGDRALLSCYTSHKWIFNPVAPAGYLRKGSKTNNYETSSLRAHLYSWLLSH